MSIRISNNMLYQGFVSNLNSSLNQLIDLNIQAQTQKRINKPSDDPVGTERVLGHRDTLRTIDQYSDNIGTGQSWLSLSDSTLTQVSTILTRVKGLAEQAATGSVSAANREQISYEVRQLFNQVIGLANTRYEGKSIYAGQKTEEVPFQERLWMTTNDSGLSGNDFNVEGSARQTVLVQFPGTSGTSATLTSGSSFRYSMDGGKTFQNGTAVPNGTDLILQMTGVTLTLDNTTPITVRLTDTNDTNDATGSWMWIRPTAQYMGDDEDGNSVDRMGVTPAGVAAVAQGAFAQNVMVRVDSATTMDQPITYSYSQDGGINWTQGNRTDADQTLSNAVLPVPGGVLILSNTSVSNFGELGTGSQFVVRPRKAAINLAVSFTESIQVNDVGKDIFGGVYQDPSSSRAEPVYGRGTMLLGSNAGLGSNATAGANVFETLGNLVAFLETNNQQGVQECLANLKLAQNQIMNRAASVGGRENRLAVTQSMLDGLKMTEEERLQRVEDADLGELMTKLAQKQVVYETVLKSSSMIMKMSLMNYL